MIDRWNIEIVHQKESTKEVESDDDEHIDQSIHVSMTMEDLPLFDRRGSFSAQPIVLLCFHGFDKEHSEKNSRSIA